MNPWIPKTGFHYKDIKQENYLPNMLKLTKKNKNSNITYNTERENTIKIIAEVLWYIEKYLSSIKDILRTWISIPKFLKIFYAISTYFTEIFLLFNF